MKTPKHDALPQKDLEDLERFHQQMKDEAQAWHTLLENLDKLKNKQPDHTDPPNPLKQPST